MKSAPIPENEAERLGRLKSYGILDSEREASFDRITRIVAESLGVPISFVSLVDEDRQWFKSHHGLDAQETPRDLAFCAHAIHDDSVLVIEDALADERFRDNPLVAGDPNIRFYAGAPLISPDGHKLGTLCAIDRSARTISDDHRLLLTDLANLVIDEMELRKARREAVAANARLEAKVAELTKSRERLEEQARRLTELAEAEAGLKAALTREIAVKDRFFSIIAHDLRSPFTALLGMSDMMVAMSDDLSREQLVDLAKKINHSGKTVHQLAENLLDWARVQMEKEKISPRALPVADLVVEIVAVLSGTARDKGVSVVNGAPELSAVGDPDMVKLVVRNLVANAIKFTPPGGRVDVAARERDDMIELSVTDNGVGVAPGMRAELFAIDRKTTTPGTGGELGTGLGLPLCREMVERNGGEIWLESEPGKGSAFFFTLPKAG